MTSFKVEHTPLSVTVLGSGSSPGVPVIGCDCPICMTPNSKNTRTRASLLLKFSNHQFVIDTGPDFRAQMLAAKVQQLDGVLYTHIHADHCHGFDDLRPFFFRSHSSDSHPRDPMPLHMAQRFQEGFRARFAYAFRDTGYYGTTPQVQINTIAEGTMNCILDQPFEAIKLPHGSMHTTGFRFGRFAYITDYKSIPSEIIDKWRGNIHTLVISGIRFGKPHPSHCTIDETLVNIAALKPERAVISHLSHTVDYEIVSKQLPQPAVLAYDGLVLDFNDHP